MLQILLAVACIAGCYADLEIEATTTFINKNLEIIPTTLDNYIFRAPTCGRYDSGYDVTVHVYNPNNPQNDANFGIAYFAVTNKQVNGTIQPSDLICKVDSDVRYTNICTGPAGKGDIYVHVKGNAKPQIFFAINVTFTAKNPMAEKTSEVHRPFYFPMLGSTRFEDLRPVISYGKVIELDYGNITRIHLSICASPVTTNRYTLTSILQADDPDSKSLIAQAICTKSKCNFDTTSQDGQVAVNAHDLPVNVATTQPPNRYEDLYIYAVAYNGVLQHGWPRGRFIFGATIDAAP